MNTTLEIVWAEVDYRLERAVGGVDLEHLRAARELHRPWWRRAFGSDPGSDPSGQENTVRPAA